MKVVGLNGREYNINLKKYIVKNNDKTVKSKYHMAARELLAEMFKGYTVLEEVKLPDEFTKINTYLLCVPVIPG